MLHKVIDNQQLFINVQKASLLFRALNNSIRQQILKLLEEHERMTVTEILIHLRQLQSITSQHLAVLRRQCLVTTMREGKNIYYALNHDKLLEVQQFVEAMLEYM